METYEALHNIIQEQLVMKECIKLLFDDLHEQKDINKQLIKKVSLLENKLRDDLK